jgi:hypothetical protein
MATLSQLSEAKEAAEAIAQPHIAQPPSRKKLIRRVGRDHSQIYRRSFQIAFLILNVWLGGLFYIWVRGFEMGTHNRAITRPAGVEGWLPIAGLMNFKYWLSAGKIRQYIRQPCFSSLAFWRSHSCFAKLSAVGSVQSERCRNISGAPDASSSAAPFTCPDGSMFLCAA